MEVRRLLRMDESRYQRLRLEAAQEDSWIPTREVVRELELFRRDVPHILHAHDRGGTQVWGVFDDMTLAGVIAVSPVSLAGNRPQLWLWGLYVRPRFRGTPASRALLGTAQAWGERQQPDGALLGAYHRHNRHAARFVDRYGFQLSGHQTEAEAAGLITPEEIVVECSHRTLQITVQHA